MIKGVRKMQDKKIISKEKFYTTFFLLFFICMVILGRMSVQASEAALVTARIPVSCSGKNTVEQFLYQLEGIQTEFETGQVTSLSLIDGETGEFIVCYSKAGIYHYTVKQTVGTEKNTEYDTTEYQVDVYVTSDGTMHAEPIIYKKGEVQKYTACKFENIKTVETDETEQQTETEGTKENNSGSSDSGTSTSGGNISGNVKTGDDSPIATLIIIFLVSAGILTLLLSRRKKDAKEE